MEKTLVRSAIALVAVAMFGPAIATMAADAVTGFPIAIVAVAVAVAVGFPVAVAVKVSR
jgi:hypothetical protein